YLRFSPVFRASLVSTSNFPCRTARRTCSRSSRAPCLASAIPRSIAPATAPAWRLCPARLARRLGGPSPFRLRLLVAEQAQLPGQLRLAVAVVPLVALPDRPAASCVPRRLSRLPLARVLDLLLGGATLRLVRRRALWPRA